MDKKNNEFLKRLLATFKIEADEHLKAISSGLLELEKKPETEKQTAIIETIFREAHSLKGAARSVSMADIEAVSRSFESIFSAWKHQEIIPSSEQFDTLHKAMDTVGKFLSSPEEGQTGIAELVRQLDRLVAGESVVPSDRKNGQAKHDVSSSEEAVRPPSSEVKEPKKKKSGKFKEKIEEQRYPGEPETETSPQIFRGYSAATEKSAQPETIRISAAKLDSLLLQTEEMLSAKQSAKQRTADFQGISDMLDIWNKEWGKIYPEVRKVREIYDKKNGVNEKRRIGFQSAKLLEFLHWNLDHFKSLEIKCKELERLADQDRRSLSMMVDNLLEDTKKVLMFPFSSFLEIFPKMVRDLCRDQKKEAELVIKGGEIEIDRRILEEIKDPLIHLVRNCIDHGIEKPEVRKSAKKPTLGTVTISIFQMNSNQVEITVSDDGAGIDLAKVKEASIKQGIISENEINRLTEQEAFSFIFESGITTSSFITDISGRGLGLAIVKEKVEKVGGQISMETKPQVGTSIRMLLPITLSTFRGVLVREGERVFIIPTTNVEQVLKISRDEIKTVENKTTIPLNGRAVSLVRLDDVLELPRKGNTDNNSEYIQVLILGSAEKRIAFSVNEIVNEQEVLVKGLNKQLSRVRNITGATVLGSGQVVPILNVPDLIKSAVKVTVLPIGAAAAVEESKEKKKSILVVEDSITSRVLLKNIMESAGYTVKTAVDGADAFVTLKTESFDLVVSDVDMPRMNGFVLTSKIRGDKKLAELPVILVTALESRDDRERGIDAGANAYIIKSSFNQSNLLETVRRLI